jgi:hypothetical protein
LYPSSCFIVPTASPELCPVWPIPTVADRVPGITLSGRAEESPSRPEPTTLRLLPKVGWGRCGFEAPLSGLPVILLGTPIICPLGFASVLGMCRRAGPQSTYGRSGWQHAITAAHSHSLTPRTRVSHAPSSGSWRSSAGFCDWQRRWKAQVRRPTENYFLNAATGIWFFMRRDSLHPPREPERIAARRYRLETACGVPILVSTTASS